MGINLPSRFDLYVRICGRDSISSIPLEYKLVSHYKYTYNSFNIQNLVIKYSKLGYLNLGKSPETLGFLGMDENESLGKYIQRRLRERGIEDKAVADILNLSVKTIPKIYKQSEIPSDRIAKISILLNENVYLHYYGSKEPLKSILNRNAQELEEKVSKLDLLIEQQAKTINDKDHIIELQNKLITELEEKLSKRDT